MSGAERSHPDAARRRFLSRAGVATAALTLGVGAGTLRRSAARAPDEPASGAKRWGLLIDAQKCARGCDACVRACDEEHGLVPKHGPLTDARWIRTVGLRHRDTGRVSTVPVMCQHCEKPPCVDVCPTGASFRRDDGIVLVDKHICIGCRYCVIACPFKARSFIHEDLTDQKPHTPRGKGTVESCTLCVHRVDAGGTPACVEACDAAGHRAIVFGDLADPGSEIASMRAARSSIGLRADLNLRAGVRYTGL